MLTPHAAAGPEIEIPAMTRGRVSVTLARIHPPGNAIGAGWTGPPTAADLRVLTRSQEIDAVAARFGDGSVDVVAYASTTTGYALGPRSESDLLERLAMICGTRVVGSARAAVDALEARGATSVLLIHPPWFDDEIDQLGVGYFRDQGFDTTLLKATGLPLDPSAITTDGITDWICRHVGPGDAALFLAGNGFRAAQAVAEVERRTGRLVLQANQVLLSSVLAAARASIKIEGWGSLFRVRP